MKSFVLSLTLLASFTFINSSANAATLDKYCYHAMKKWVGYAAMDLADIKEELIEEGHEILADDAQKILNETPIIQRSHCASKGIARKTLESYMRKLEPLRIDTFELNSKAYFTVTNTISDLAFLLNHFHSLPLW